jgi:hypothetical protein
LFSCLLPICVIHSIDPTNTLMGLLALEQQTCHSPYSYNILSEDDNSAWLLFVSYTRLTPQTPSWLYLLWNNKRATVFTRIIYFLKTTTLLASYLCHTLDWPHKHPHGFTCFGTTNVP